MFYKTGLLSREGLLFSIYGIYHCAKRFPGTNIFARTFLFLEAHQESFMGLDEKHLKEFFPYNILAQSGKRDSFF